MLFLRDLCFSLSSLTHTREARMGEGPASSCAVAGAKPSDEFHAKAAVILSAGLARRISLKPLPQFRPIRRFAHTGIEPSVS
jgi:hypothetical protein